MTPSKLVKSKSLGFVRLGYERPHVGGGTHATEEKQPVGKYPGLGLGLGRRVDSDAEEDYGNQQQRTRRKSFSRLLLDRDKPKDREDHGNAYQGRVARVHGLGLANQLGGEA